MPQFNKAVQAKICKFTMHYLEYFFILATVCILTCSGRSLESQNAMDDLQDVQQDPRPEYIYNSEGEQFAVLKRVKRYVGYNNSEEVYIVPYINTGSAYFNADGTQIKAPIFNYGYHDFPKYLVPDKQEHEHHHPQHYYHEEESPSPE